MQNVIRRFKDFISQNVQNIVISHFYDLKSQIFKNIVKNNDIHFLRIFRVFLIFCFFGIIIIQDNEISFEFST